jgi:hypothetical protein
MIPLIVPLNLLLFLLLFVSDLLHFCISFVNFVVVLARGPSTVMFQVQCLTSTSVF